MQASSDEASSAGASRLIFVGGSPRSGTTLVQNILDTHTDVLGGPEFLHLPDFVRLRNQLHSSIRRDYISIMCSYEDIDAHIRRTVEALLLDFADKHNAKFLSEKTPENVLVFSSLAEIFPDTKFLNVVRDPRAVVSSLLTVGAKARKRGVSSAVYTQDTFAAIEKVRQCLRAGFKAQHAYPERIKTVVYEELVDSTSAVIEGVCDFLGISWQPDMCEPGSKSHLGEQAITVKSGEVWYDKDSYNRNPDRQSLDGWKDSLSVAQQMAIASVFSSDKDLAALGYDFSIADASRVQKLTGRAYCLGGKVAAQVRRRVAAKFATPA